MQAGDKIISVNGETIYDWSSFQNWITNNPIDIIDVIVERGSSNYSLTIDRNDEGLIGVFKQKTGIETINVKVGLS